MGRQKTTFKFSNHTISKLRAIANIRATLQEIKSTYDKSNKYLDTSDLIESEMDLSQSIISLILNDLNVKGVADKEYLQDLKNFLEGK